MCVVSAAEQAASVSVVDTGIGIAREDLPRLFNRFERIQNVRTSHVAGTGLGLYLSRELARQHGGDIQVESRPGAGSRFTLTLPLAAPIAETEAPVIAEPEPPRLHVVTPEAESESQPA